MFRTFVFVAIIGLFTLMGAGTATAAEIKIGVVSISRLMEQSPQAQEASKLLEKRFSSREAELTSEREALHKLEEQLQRDGDIMAASKRTALEDEIRNRTRDFKRAWDNFKEDVNIARNEELGKLQKQLLKAIIDISKAEKFDLVLTDNVIYASDQVDITDKVIARLAQSPQSSGQ